MKHFMANSNEDGRDSTSSDFDERLFEYYSYPFYKGITEGGSVPSRHPIMHGTGSP